MVSPKISIITVVYNGAALLEKTISSIARQSYTNIEYIIIDGDSKDNTLEIIENNKKHISTWISEKDEGLYDAMNKGLSIATGDYLWYINAGDCIYDDFVLEKVFASDANADIYFGECCFIDEQGNELGLRSELTTQQLPTQLTWQSMKKGMVVSHQSFIVRRSLAPPYIMDNWCADIDWVIKALKNADKIHNTGLVLSKFLVGGLSQKKHRASMIDRYEVLKTHFGLFPNLWNHAQIVWRMLTKKS